MGLHYDAPPFPNIYSLYLGVHFPRSSRRKRILLLSVPISVLLRCLLKQVPLASILIGDASLQRVIRVGFDEQLAHGLKDLAQLGGRLPVLGFQGGYTDVAGAVVGHVGMVDPRVERHDGRFERVVVGQLDNEPEGAATVGSVVGTREENVPGLKVGF